MWVFLLHQVLSLTNTGVGYKVVDVVLSKAKGSYSLHFLVLLHRQKIPKLFVNLFGSFITERTKGFRRNLVLCFRHLLVLRGISPLPTICRNPPESLTHCSCTKLQGDKERPFFMQSLRTAD